MAKLYRSQPPHDKEDRRLMVSDVTRQWELIFPKAGDVPKYLEKGMADVGVVGSDVLEEYGSFFVDPIPLNMGGCDMVIAGRPRQDALKSGLTVATKYPEVARRYFEGKGISVKIISLSGSVELAVTTGIAEVIVDIVQTGKTLKDNGLVVLETLFPVCAYVVRAQGLCEEKNRAIDALISAASLRKVV